VHYYRRRRCLSCSSHLRSATLSSLDGASPKLRAALGHRDGMRPHRASWLPSLTQSLYAPSAMRGPGASESGTLSAMPCAMARSEDVAILRNFFSDADGEALPANGASFLEMGGYDGAAESTSWLFEQCYGWRGILIEASPQPFEALLRNRPSSLNLRLAACAAPGTLLMASTNHPTTNRAVNRVSDLAGATGLINATCGPIGLRLSQLFISRLDLFSLDVEGAEMAVLQTLDLGTRLAVGVMMVEARGDGQREEILRLLLGRGLLYVGAVHGDPSSANEVVSDVYVNLTHLRAFFPDSRALQHLRA